jgi:chemotaxis protein CheZ
MISSQEENRLKKELIGLFAHMNKMRRELAVLQGSDTSNFLSVSDTLDAIVENTETASNQILESMEAIEEMVLELRRMANPAVSAVCDRISERSSASPAW